MRPPNHRWERLVVEPLQRWQRVFVVMIGILTLAGAFLWIWSRNHGGEVVLPAPWVLLESPDPASAQIVIYVQGGGCNHDRERLGPIDVQESDARVVIAAHLVKPEDEPSDCNDIGTQHAASVKLAAQLGERTLVDPTCEPTAEQLEVHDCRPAALE